MTVLAAFQGNGFSVIGSDSRATDGGGGMFILANPKVTLDRTEKYVYAITGASRGGNLLQQGWTPPDAPAFIDANHLDEFMTQSFIPNMRDVFIDAGYDAKEDGDSAWHDGGFLVSVHGIIYPIFSDYSWDRDLRNIYAAGSGGDLALGAMTALKIEKCVNSPARAKTIILKALEAACAHNAFCAPPFVIETQFKD